MKLRLKYFDPSDITTFVNKGTGKHIISDGFTTIPVYKGKQYSIKDVVNSDGTVNIRKAKKIMEEVAEYFGGKKMQNRPENPVWHKDDPNTWLHTKKVAKNAWANRIRWLQHLVMILEKSFLEMVMLKFPIILLNRYFQMPRKNS